MSDQVKNAKTSSDRKGRSWLRISLWVFTIALLVLALLAAFLWVNRYSLLTSQAQKELIKAGIEADFDIESIDKTAAVFNNVRLTDEDGLFLTADTLTINYRFDQLRAGIIDKVSLKAPVLRITLDGSGNLIDSWVPETSENTQPIALPKDGISIENGVVNWAAPWGAGAMGIDADIASETQWKSQINMQSARFSRENVAFDFSYVGNIDRISEFELVVSGQIQSSGMQAYQSSAGPLQADVALNLMTTPETEFLSINGEVGLTVNQGQFPKFNLGNARLDVGLDARYNFGKQSFDLVEAQWDVDGADLSLSDPDFRDQLVRRTMSYEALSKTPIAMHFADEFERNGSRLLQAFEVSGSGKYTHDQSGYKIDLNAPFLINSQGQKLTLSPSSGSEIAYNADNQKISLNMNGVWKSSRNLILNDFRLIANSENGLVVNSVERVSTEIVSTQTWRKKRGGETFRLAPLKIGLGYTNNSQGGRVSIIGNIDYDGRLPGGSAKTLRAGGEVIVTTVSNSFAMSFAPTSRITLDSFTSTTGWQAENVSLDLEDGKNILTRRPGVQPFQAVLKNVSALISSPEDDRHLNTFFGDMRINSDFQRSPQVWDMDISDIDIKSEDFPSPGTHVQSPASTAAVTQYADGSLEFIVTSPHTEISTDNVDVVDLFIELYGRPEDFSARYKAGLVNLKGGEIPQVPMEGTARLQYGVLTGSAVAPMPKTNNTPINITYHSQDGVGGMKVSIPRVNFTPRGLQPQYLIPALRGKLAAVTGEAAAEFEFAFGDGGPVRSFGTTTLKNMDIGTLVGPASGVSAELKFKSMFPLETDGVQTATLAGFDAGFPLENGTIKFEVVPEGIRIDQAEWPVFSEGESEGKIFISPLLWKFGNVKNQAIVNVENLSLGKILEGVGNGSLSGTGQISGVLPATVDGVNVQIHDGVLAIKDGGVIRYRNQGIDTFAKDAKQPAFLGDSFAGSETGFAFKALENFQYKELEARIDGPLDGEMTLRMVFDGKNPDLLAGTAFEFDVAVSGELGNIARDSIGAFDAQKHLDSIIDIRRDEDLDTGK